MLYIKIMLLKYSMQTKVNSVKSSFLDEWLPNVPENDFWCLSHAVAKLCYLG